jgi:Skp family chaperone for outer membrane proteins
MQAFQKITPWAAFCLYFLKVGILGSSYPDALILGILGTFVAFLEYKNNDKKIEELKEIINGRQKDLENHIKDIDNLKSYMNSQKMATSMRPVSTR